MKVEALLALLRHGLTTAGALLVSGGFTTEEAMTGAVGAVVFLAGFGWSLWRKKARELRETSQRPGP